jgi:hypothetical protein
MSGRTTAEAALDRYRLVYGDGEQVVRETPCLSVATRAEQHDPRQPGDRSSRGAS